MRAMIESKIKHDIERWLVHEGLVFVERVSPKNTFHILIKQAGQFGVPVDVFEPKKQPGVIVIGSKVTMMNSHIARYMKFNNNEKIKFKERLDDYCISIRAVHRIITENGKQKIGVYIVLDNKIDINQKTIFDSIDKVSEMHEKLSSHLLKTF